MGGTERRVTPTPKRQYFYFSWVKKKKKKKRPHGAEIQSMAKTCIHPRHDFKALALTVMLVIFCLDIFTPLQFSAVLDPTTN